MDSARFGGPEPGSLQAAKRHSESCESFLLRPPPPPCVVLSRFAREAPQAFQPLFMPLRAASRPNLSGRYSVSDPAAHSAPSFKAPDPSAAREMFRPAVSSDLPALRDLLSDCFPPEEAADAARALAHHFACRLHGLEDGREPWIACEPGGGDAVLALGGLRLPQWNRSGGVWLSWLAVRRSARRAGLGSRMVGFLCARARDRGFENLFVETYDGAAYDPARSFYASLGFRPAGRITASGPRREDAVVLVRRLTV